MNSQSEKVKDGTLDLLAWYQILGGIAGGIIWIIVLLKSFAILNFPVIIITTLALLVYFYSFLSGYVLLKDRNVGLQISLINQILQVFGFTLGGITFQYSSGLGFNLELNFSTDEVRLGYNVLISSLRVFWGVNEQVKEICLNLVALLLVIFIYRRMKSTGRESMQDTIDQIGVQAEDMPAMNPSKDV